ncbi:hypothetical protein AVEN_77407-1 [Araneus ventricosus]|uniref:Secreted protein n=1 Tax=Araneus ventricosus TaxID=182803 RepID=A0A4Y2C837_ARAVE|nr:hypothetical protein AVEN_77407-1 [Araneus ventricosus]
MRATLICLFAISNTVTSRNPSEKKKISRCAFRRNPGSFQDRSIAGSRRDSIEDPLCIWQRHIKYVSNALMLVKRGGLGSEVPSSSFDPGSSLRDPSQNSLCAAFK